MAITGRPCVICGEPDTVRSHLLPAAVGREIKGEQKNFWIGSIQRDGKALSQSGVFDNFLCSDHEAFINTYENEAIEFLRSFALTDDEKRAGWYRREANTEVLTRFVCSVLWRYHQSTRKEAGNVNLGGWEPVLRDITFGGDIATAPDTLCFGMYHEVIPNNRFAFSPARGRYDGRVIWSTVVNGVAFMTKLDKQPFPSAHVRDGRINGKEALEGRAQEMAADDIQRVKIILDRMRAK
jgi:hypothetical protein